MAKTRKIGNNYAALARHFQVWDVGKLADFLQDAGWAATTQSSMLRHVGHKGEPADVDALIRRGYPINGDTRPCLNQTMLHLAAQRAKPDMVKHLLDTYKMDPNQPGIDTPLVMAISHLRCGTAKALLEAGASPEGSAHCLFKKMGYLLAKKPGEKSPATVTSAMKLLGILCDGGASINEIDAFGRTPLYYAIIDVGHRHPWAWAAVEKKLLRRGLDMGSEDTTRVIAEAIDVMKRWESNGSDRRPDFVTRLEAAATQARLEILTGVSKSRSNGLRL
jgi:hypothetical protein